jgi:hypothetical protein
MKRVWNRLVWGLLTLLAGAAWVALWIFIFTLLVVPLGYAWANMIQFWGIFLGLFWITLKSLWVWHDMKRAGDI